MDYERLIGLIARHMPSATRRTLTRWEVNLSGRCRDPVWRMLHAPPMRPEQIEDLTRKGKLRAIGYEWEPGMNYPLTVEMQVRCRKCEWCARVRRKLWEHRAIAEVEASTRTWFMTMTLTPHEHFMVVTRARNLDYKAGLSFDARKPEDRFAIQCGLIGPEITKFQKRVRKTCGAPLRFLWVYEAHKSGLPHIHGLVHETSEHGTVRKRTLQSNWRLGFSQVKLADASAARYVCKYLTKSIESRVRSSLSYGQPHALIAPPERTPDGRTG